LTQGIDQTRKAMESYLDFFQKTMKAPPLLDANLNQKMKTYMEQNLPLCLSLRRK
jgi:tetrahydromethanopterin S-methyltransferase subunit H